MLYNSGKHELAKPRKLSFKEIRDIAQSEFDEAYIHTPVGFLGRSEGIFTCLKGQYKLICVSCFIRACEKLYNCILDGLYELSSEES